MTFTSFAQNFEDVILWRALKTVERGFYIDIGANDPVGDSVSKSFYDRGWRGINVEPMPFYAARLREARPHDLTIEGVVSSGARPVTLHQFAGTGMTTAREEFARQHLDAGHAVETIVAQPTPLSEIFKRADAEIHWMKVDVEGMEADVLASWGDHEARPWIAVVEATLPNSTEQDHEKWEHELTNRGYRFVYFDGLNRFYVHKDHADLAAHFGPGPNFFDHFRLSEYPPAASELSLRLEASERARMRAEERATKAAESISTAIETAISAVRAEASDNRARLDAALSAAIRERDAAAQRLAETEQRVAAANAEAARNIEALAAETAAKNREAARAREMVWEARRAQQHAQHVEARLKATYESASWKVTAPLRAVGMAARKITDAGRTAFRRTARPVLSGALQAVRAAPPLKRGLHAIARSTPLGKPFLRFAENRPQATAPESLAVAGPFILSSALPAQCDAPGKRTTLYYYVDHTIACPVNTGMQRVVRGLASGLAAASAPIVFVKWSRKSRMLVRVNRAELDHLAKWNGPKANPAEYPDGDEEHPIEAHDPRDRSWLIVPEVAHINHHGDEPTLEIIMAAKELKLRTAFVFYDAIPLRRPEFLAIAQKHENYMRAMLLADFIAPISRWSGVDLASYFKHHELSDLKDGPVIEPMHLPGRFDLGAPAGKATQEKLILAVGTIEKRKNQITLIAAFEKFCTENPGVGWRLALVGNLHPDMADAIHAAAKRNPAIEYCGNISDAELGALYERCAFTLFPSVEEGFGLPILESLAHGKPCICANFGAMAEIAEGGGALMVDTNRADEISVAIAELALDATALARLSDEAKRRPLETWGDYATKFRKRLTQNASPLTRIGRIYYCVHSTATVPFNSGIQRVVRGLAKSLIDLGFKLVPIKWSKDANGFIIADERDLNHLQKWNGPSPDSWSLKDRLEDFRPTDWLMSAELLLDPGDLDSVMVESWAKKRSLQTAWIFYDAIPWKLRAEFDPDFSDMHMGYSRGLRTANLVAPISEYSASEFARFLTASQIRIPGHFEIVRPVLLPGELTERPRALTPKQPAFDKVRKILCVCTVERRKNHIALLEAFLEAKKVSRAHLELHIVGRAALDPELLARIEGLVASDRSIHWHHNIDDKGLADFYASCDFTVYPSIEEGFGLPILESLWAARPCICRSAGAMLEVAAGGGCLLVETTNVAALRDAIVLLAEDDELRLRLAREAISRKFKSWLDYGDEVASALAVSTPPTAAKSTLAMDRSLTERMLPNLATRPRLSVCITTYNRAAWLAVALKNLARIIPDPRSDVEIIVVDNASPDNTPGIVKPYLGRRDFRYVRNPKNVGMLGNLRVTAHEARGDYVWILGDDDLASPGSIDAILGAINTHSDAALVYLNYGYTREDKAANVGDLDQFFASATPISTPGPDRYGPIASFSAVNENFFTAIYCLVFRRDHALRAYSQDTSGRPFSTMLTSIPTTYHVLHHMMGEPGVWVGEPQLVVNMNVSWLKYAPLWILERLPEAFDVAEKNGAPPDELDRRRIDLLPSVEHWFAEFLRDDPEGNRAFIDPRRLAIRFGHLEEFRALAPELAARYREAKNAGMELPELSPEEFEQFCNVEQRVDA